MKDNMTETSLVIVFPSVFAKKRIPLLISNIKKILKIKNLEFSFVKQDNDIIIIEANDPVFASAVINLLFGIKKVAIARQIRNEFDSLISEVTKLGGNMLLKGEEFFVKVEGSALGFLTSDAELAITSSIIEKKSKLGAKPGSEEKHDKLLYIFLTKSFAYICIFIDKGHDGVPYGTQNQKVVCSIYDELSAVSCLETIKQGFDTKIIVCYKKDSELLNLAKILNQILPMVLELKVDVEFFHIKSPKLDSQFLNIVTEVLIYTARKNKISRISLALSPLIFPVEIFDKMMLRVFQNKITAIFPLSGLDDNIFQSAREIGLEKHLGRIEKLTRTKFSKIIYLNKKAVTNAINSKKVVSIKIGPNNVHEILDSFDNKH